MRIMRNLLFVFAIFLGINAFSVDSLIYIKNNGQWHENVMYKASTREGSIFLERNKFTFTYYSRNDLSKFKGFHHSNSTKEEHHPEIETPNLPGFSDSTGIRLHTINMTFLNLNQNTIVNNNNKRKEYFNYFIGNDQNKWQGKVPAFNEVEYENLYNGINLRTYSSHRKMKYDFIVSPNANTNNIQIQYNGADSIKIINNDLVVYTSLGEKRELAPFAYQIINGDTIEVTCNYNLNNNILMFDFPNGYDNTKTLIIDPTLVASTFTGTANASENYGHSATYDQTGNMYIGACSFGAVYETTTGAFMTSYPGGGTSIGISKFNPDGTQLLYGTLIGGNQEEYPHSIVVSEDAEELYLYGSSESGNYPTTSGSFQPNKNADIDIVISRFSTDGSTLIASTFVGGNDDDGENMIATNYGDDYRGEIVLDDNNDVYIASFTNSDNFYTTSGAIQTQLVPGSPWGYAQAGVFFRMNSDLSNLEYSTYFGGAGSNASASCYGITVDDSYNMYVTGTIKGTTGHINWTGAVTYAIGDYDGYAIKVSPTGTLLASTYFGTGGKDESFFIDITHIKRRTLQINVQIRY